MSRFRPFFVAAAVVVAAVGSASAGPIIADPVGDRFGSTGPDITGIGADHFDNPGFVTFTVQFAGPIAPPSAFAPNSVTGFIDIDADKNPATGNTNPFVNQFGGSPPFNLGSELSVDLFSELFHPGMVDVTDGFGGTVLATVPITFGPSGFTFLVPNSVFTGVGGSVSFNYAAVFGDFLAPSDRVPNGATPLASTPEPTSLAAFGFLALAAGAAVRRKTPAASPVA